LLDKDLGVYRYDGLVVLSRTRSAAVLLEAGSIINRDEELLMGSPERQSAVSAAVLDAVESFCAVRKPRQPDRARAAAAAKPALSPSAPTTQSATSVKPR
jgi:hypothetical protein